MYPTDWVSYPFVLVKIGETINIILRHILRISPADAVDSIDPEFVLD